MRARATQSPYKPSCRAYRLFVCAHRIAWGGSACGGRPSFRARGKAIGMATVSLSPGRRFELFSVIAGLFRRRWFARGRRVCQACRACGTKLEVESNLLMRRGYYRAAVFTRRLQLEMLLSAMVQRVLEAGNNELRPKHRVATAMVPFLKYHDALSKANAHRVNVAYARASRAVHGGACTYDRAVQIINEIEETIGHISSAHAAAEGLALVEYKIIAGFAAVGAV